ncbi:hypothetical protein OVA07_04135 [Novosphingobium sp. SL115]|uniref:surface-adhesin E family protein n=1 Tax=Novosphingobium sp. SL115 TaxID=2995150 RepID=UPI002275593D|nr:surface-adhesin E family protein [Novosphingobium sp. SL115]MCY1670196.1 hypothetical protein [Novosphingobium sp. SL115]
MIAFRTALLPLALLGLSGEALAKDWSADWQIIGVAPDRTKVLVRPSSVQELPPRHDRAFAVRQVWAGFDFTAAAAPEQGRKIILFRYDCSAQRVLIAAATDYAANGTLLARNAVDADRADQYEPVEPDTLNAAIMAEACPA